MQRSVSQPMGSWWPSGAVFPPLPASVILDSLPPRRRRTSARAGRRIRPERHNPRSIRDAPNDPGAPLAAAAPLLPLLWIFFRLSVDVEIDFIDARLSRGA